MDRKILIGLALIIVVAGSLLILFDNPRQRFYCRIISDTASVSGQQILADGRSCPYSLTESKNIRFEYEDRVASGDETGQQILLNADCHNSIAEKVSPIGQSYGPENEKFVLGPTPNEYIYFCMRALEV